MSSSSFRPFPRPLVDANGREPAPDHDHLWVLSRDPFIDTKVLAGLVKRAEKEFGYSKVQERLHCTKQPKGANIACEDVLRSQS